MELVGRQWLEAQRQLITFRLDFKGGADKFADGPILRGQEGLRTTPVSFCPEQVQQGGFWVGRGAQF